MSHQCLTRRGYILKKKELSDEDEKRIIKDLTFQPIAIQAFAQLTQPKKFTTFLETELRYYLPRYYAIENYGEPTKTRLDDNITKINSKFYWDLLPHQEKPWQALYDQFMVKQSGGIFSIYCGAGKTILAIKLIIELGVKAIVVVNKEFLMKQWISAIESCSNARIGVIQRNKVDVEDKDIVIAMLHSISMKDYPDNIFADFGLCAIDECFPYKQHISTNDGPYEIGKLFYMWEKDPNSLPLVKSFNQTTKDFEYKKITHAWKKRATKLIKFTLSKNVVKCTENHLFLTTTGWTKAADINIGTLILGNYDTEISNCVSEIRLNEVNNKEIQSLTEEINVFDLEIEDNHNFIVCNKKITTGLIAHNCHHIASNTFSKSLPKISCKYTLGLSATPIRKDGLTEVFLNYLGPVFYSERRQGTNQVCIKFIEISSASKHYDVEMNDFTGTKDTGKMVTNIASFETINHLILEICRILVKNPDRPRKILVLGARREQLEWLNEKWNELSYKNYKNKIASGGLYYGNQKMNKKLYWDMLDKSADCDILWGTNDIAKEGLDIPDLNTLILLSGGRDVEQSVGRILRKYHEKTPPTIIDMVYKCGNFPTHARERREYYDSENYICHKFAIEVEDDVTTLSTKQLDFFLEDYPKPGDVGVLKPLKKNKRKEEIPIGNHPTELLSIQLTNSSESSSQLIKKKTISLEKKQLSIPVEKEARVKNDHDWLGDDSDEDKNKEYEQTLNDIGFLLSDSEDDDAVIVRQHQLKSSKLPKSSELFESSEPSESSELIETIINPPKSCSEIYIETTINSPKTGPDLYHQTVLNPPKTGPDLYHQTVLNPPKTGADLYQETIVNLPTKNTKKTTKLKSIPLA